MGCVDEVAMDANRFLNYQRQYQKQLIQKQQYQQKRVSQQMKPPLYLSNPPPSISLSLSLSLKSLEGSYQRICVVYYWSSNTYIYIRYHDE